MQEVLDHPRALSWERRNALVLMGRQGELTDPADVNQATVLVARGAFDEALRIYGHTFRNAMFVRHAAGLDAWIAGDRARALALFAVPPGAEFHQIKMIIPHYVMVPFLRELGGERGAMAAHCAEVIATRRWVYMQHPWYCARYLAGEIGEPEFLAQPHNAFAPAHLAICQGVRAELAGDRAAAHAAYRRFLEIPLYRRELDLDAVVDRFVAWRAEQTADE
jgi:hypothetical protein